jgi:hypothetical protein
MILQSGCGRKVYGVTGIPIMARAMAFVHFMGHVQAQRITNGKADSGRQGGSAR